MILFIQFNAVQGGVLNLRPDTIIGCYAASKNLGGVDNTFTVLILSSGDQQYVRETPDQVEQMIVNALEGQQE